LLVSKAGFVTTTRADLQAGSQRKQDGGTTPRKDHAQDVSLSFYFVRRLLFILMEKVLCKIIKQHNNFNMKEEK